MHNNDDTDEEEVASSQPEPDDEAMEEVKRRVLEEGYLPQLTVTLSTSLDYFVLEPPFILPSNPPKLQDWSSCSMCCHSKGKHWWVQREAAFEEEKQQQH